MQTLNNRDFVDFLIGLQMAGNHKNNIILGGSFVLQAVYNTDEEPEDIDIFINNPTALQKKMIHALMGGYNPYTYYIKDLADNKVSISLGYHDFSSMTKVNFVLTYFDHNKIVYDTFLHRITTTSGIWVDILVYKPNVILDFKMQFNRDKDARYIEKYMDRIKSVKLSKRIIKRALDDSIYRLDDIDDSNYTLPF